MAISRSDGLRAIVREKIPVIAPAVSSSSPDTSKLSQGSSLFHIKCLEVLQTGRVILFPTQAVGSILSHPDTVTSHLALDVHSGR